MLRTLNVCFTALLLMLSVSTSFAQVVAVPNSMNFQGRLAKPNGTPVPDGTYSIRFRLYDALTDGNIKFEQIVSSVQVKNGVFAATLSGFPAGTFKSNLWLGIKIGADTELSPRQPLVSVAYAFKADSVKDGSITSSSLTTNAVTTSKVSNLAITDAKLADNAVQSAKIADLAVTNAKIQSVDWSKIVNAPSSTGWSLTGNSGTIPGTHFLGSLDNNPLEFRVNSHRAIRYQYAEVTNGQGSEHRSINILGGSEINEIDAGVVGATIAGGGQDFFTGTDYPNRVTQHFGTIGGGVGNTAGSLGTVGGGYGNIAIGNITTVGGGFNNTASDLATTVSGGSDNRASNFYATIGGGRANFASGDSSTVGGGAINGAMGEQSTVGGGSRNIAIGGATTIAGGYNNTANHNISTVGGGATNSAGGFAATIGGGQSNLALMQYATIAGGLENKAGDYATVGGGHGNNASNYYVTVGGGRGNIASELAATIGGGLFNTASGENSTIAGGAHNIASGGNSFAAGNRAQALHFGVFVWADATNADFASTAAHQFLIRAGGGVGINTNNPSGYALRVNGSVAGVGNYNNVSDVRYKHHVAPFENALDTILNLRGVTFDWRKEVFQEMHFPVGRQIGFIAQEVEKVLPELVTTDSNGYKSVAYANVVPILVEAVKSLKQENETTRKENAELKAVLADVLKRLEKVEASHRR